jgi:hypothetical protein
MTAHPSGLLDGTETGSGGAPGWAASAPHILSETKLGIVTAMRVLKRPTTPQELRVIWGGRKPLSVFDYHLCTLVRAGVAEFITDGPALRFRLAGGARPSPSSTRLQRAVPLALG